MGWRDGWCPVWTGGDHRDSGRWSHRWAAGDGGTWCGSPLLPSVLLVKSEPEEKVEISESGKQKDPGNWQDCRARHRLTADLQPWACTCLQPLEHEQDHRQADSTQPVKASSQGREGRRGLRVHARRWSEHRTQTPKGKKRRSLK